MNEYVHGANATFHHKNLNGNTIAKMVNFMVKGVYEVPVRTHINLLIIQYVRVLALYTEVPFAGIAKKNRLRGDSK
jgi:hypothetical protein